MVLCTARRDVYSKSACCSHDQHFYAGSAVSPQCTELSTTGRQPDLCLIDRSVFRIIRWLMAVFYGGRDNPLCQPESSPCPALDVGQNPYLDSAGTQPFFA